MALFTAAGNLATSGILLGHGANPTLFHAGEAHLLSFGDRDEQTCRGFSYLYWCPTVRTRHTGRGRMDALDYAENANAKGALPAFIAGVEGADMTHRSRSQRAAGSTRRFGRRLG